MNHARGLVAHDKRLLVGDIVAVNATVVPEVHVTPADADVGDTDNDLVCVRRGVEGWDGVVLDLGCAGAIEVDRGVLALTLVPINPDQVNSWTYLHRLPLHLGYEFREQLSHVRSVRLQTGIQAIRQAGG